MDGVKGQRWVRALLIWVLIGGVLGAVTMLIIPVAASLEDPVAWGLDLAGLTVFVVMGLAPASVTTLAGALVGLGMARLVARQRLVLGLSIGAVLGVIVGVVLVFAISIAVMGILL